MAARRSARAHKRVQHESTDEDFLEDSEKELTSADVVVKSQPVVEDEKTAKIQEKNRRAQRKFRERRKERMNHMEKSILSLNDQIKALKVENRMFKDLLSVKERQLQQASKGGAEQEGPGLSYPDYDPIDMSWLPGYNDAALSNEKIRSMTDEELRAMCMKIFSMLDQQLRMCESANPSAIDHKLLSSLVKGGTSFWARCLLVEPVRTREVVGRIQSTRQGAGDNGGAVSVPRSMLSEMGLSVEQMQKMSRAWMKYKAALEQMLGDREACSKELMLLRPDPSNEMRNLQIFLQENRVVEQLRATMQRENKLFLECMHEVSHNVLEPMQLARFMLHGKPYMDMLSLCKAVAVELEGEESAMLQPAARQRSVLGAALDNVGVDHGWLDPEMSSGLKSLSGRVAAAQNSQSLGAQSAPALPPQPVGFGGDRLGRTPLTSLAAGVPLQAGPSQPVGSLYEGLTQFRSSRAQYDAPVHAFGAAGAGEGGAAGKPPPPMTASKERNMVLTDIFSAYQPSPRQAQSPQRQASPAAAAAAAAAAAHHFHDPGADMFAPQHPHARQPDMFAQRPQDIFAQHPSELAHPADVGHASDLSRRSDLSHPGDPFARMSPRHTPLDGESAFMAPGVNSGASISLNDGPANLEHHSVSSLARAHPDAHPADVGRLDDVRTGLSLPQASLDVFANFEPVGGAFADSGLMSRFTSTSLHLMESSCELRHDQRHDTLMNMIDRLPDVGAGAPDHHGHVSINDAFDAAAMGRQAHAHLPAHAPAPLMHANSHPMLNARGLATGNSFHGHRM